LNYTYNETDDPNGEKLVQRPENKVHFNTRYRFLKKAMVNLYLFWVGDREANEGSYDIQFYGRVDSVLYLLHSIQEEKYPDTREPHSEANPA